MSELDLNQRRFLSLAALTFEEPSLIRTFIQELLKLKVFFLSACPQSADGFSILGKTWIDEYDPMQRQYQIYPIYATQELADSFVSDFRYKDGPTIVESMPAKSLLKSIAASEILSRIEFIFSKEHNPIQLSMPILAELFQLQTTLSSPVAIDLRRLDQIELSSEALYDFRQSLIQIPSIKEACIGIINHPEKTELILNYLSDDSLNINFLANQTMLIAIKHALTCDTVGSLWFPLEDEDKYRRMAEHCTKIL